LSKEGNRRTKGQRPYQRANPLTDIAHVSRRAGVMVRGRWHAQADLQARLDQIAAAYAR
jgi:hypothetical protein